MSLFYKIIMNFGAAVWLFMLGCLVAGPILMYSLLTKLYASAKICNGPSAVPYCLDSNLERNLASTFEQDYPNFELVCSVENETDPAVKVFLKLQKIYPNVKSKLIIGLRDVGPNPKVNNLVTGYEEATSEIIWILDSNVTVDKRVLNDAVYYFQDPKVGLVHHIPCAVQLSTLGSFLDGAFLSCSHMRMYALINAWKVASCVIGKSNLYKKKDMEELGGLAQFGKYLAEDNCIGIAFFKSGKKHVIARDFAYQSMGAVSVLDFIIRRTRWIRVRKYTVFFSTLIEPFSECFVCAYLGSLYFNHYYNFSTPIFMLLTTVFWLISDMSIALQVYGSSPTKPINYLFTLKFIGAWIVKELITIPVYIYAMAGSDIEWRHQLYHLNSDGSAVPVVKKKVE